MYRWKCFVCIAVSGFFLGMLFCPLPLWSKEETVHMSFDRAAVAARKTETYIVRPGEYLYRIVEVRYGGPRKKIRKLIDEIRALNPGIADINVIYPGQKLLLPVDEDVTLPLGVAAEPMVERIESPPQGQSADRESFEYVVKRGQTVSDIIHDELGASYNEIYRILATVRKLNPRIPDIDRIGPGQKILLPRLRLRGGAVPVEAKRLPAMATVELMPAERRTAVIERVATLMKGTFIGEGVYHVPLVPSGEVVLNCSTVPVIEFPSGMTVFYDSNRRIPAALRSVIETSWKGYRILPHTSGDLPSVIGELAAASGAYRMVNGGSGGSITAGANPEVTIAVDCSIVPKHVSGGGVSRIAFNVAENEHGLVPENVRRYFDGEGVKFVEVVAGEGLREDRGGATAGPVTELAASSRRELVASLFAFLNVTPGRDAQVSLFSMSTDGFALSMKADFLVATDSGDVLVSFDTVPRQFVDILKERGSAVVVVGNNDEKETIVERLLAALHVSFVKDSFRFPIFCGEAGEGGEIVLPALKVARDDGDFYLVDYSVNDDLRAFLEAYRGVRIGRF